MHSGMFYRGGTSLTNRLAGEGTSTGGEGVVYGSPYPAGYPDPDIGIHQKLDAILVMFNEHKAELRAETAQVREEVGSLLSEVSKLKQKLEEPLQHQTVLSQRSRIPRDISVNVAVTLTFYLYFARCYTGSSEDTS